MLLTDNRTIEPKSRAFTLLELVIVLLVMVGMLAVVWPNLQRPLQRTSLDEAAQMVRDAIDESRYQAALRGTVQFVQLQQGSNQLHTGSFDSFLNSDSDLAAVLPTALSAQSSPPQVAPPTSIGLPSRADEGASTAVRAQPVRTWQLPTTVVIHNVDWTLESVLPPRISDQNQIDSDEYPTERDFPADTTGDPTINAGEFDPTTNRQWWLPLTAEGRGRDATIELLDTSIDQLLYVTYAAATGALEITR